MTLFSRFLFMMLLVIISLSAFTQTHSGNYDPIYGYDALLYNGKSYNFYSLPGTNGTQYLNDEFDKKGAITIRGVTFTNLSINYDIYNQKLILKYNDALGSTRFIEISKAWLESFVMNGLYFTLFTETDSTKRIYQVLGSGNARILYYHSKDLSIDNSGTAAGHFFTDGTKEFHVLINNRLIKCKNNGNFIKAFSTSRQESIKTYIRTHSINVRKSNDFIINDLINYCNTLTGS